MVRGLISDRGAVRIDELAADFGVSEMTIRRDLDELEALGVARRVRGGALALGPEPFARTASPQRSCEGSYRGEAAPSPACQRHSGLRRIDHDPPTRCFARDRQGSRGRDERPRHIQRPRRQGRGHRVPQRRYPGAPDGQPRRPDGGAPVESYLYDVFVCSAAALDLEVGSSEAALAESEVKWAFSQTSRRIILAVDQSKLGTRAQARMFDLEQLDLLVTDLDPADARLDEYRGRVELK